ncbi:MAG: NUDIX domain-containing protein [Anaerolineales bacterium]|nr:NUDIX domain-containing protein [Anaerolineales bacterium]
MFKPTWDGQLISQEKPHGVTIVIYRRAVGGVEFLILHRTHYLPEFEGDWAWTPPSGARYPGEAVEVCAQRELFEETGLELVPTLTDCGTEGWWVFMAEMPREGEIRLSVEHDQFAWVGQEDAGRCQPEAVESQIRQVAHLLENQ